MRLPSWTSANKQLWHLEQHRRPRPVSARPHLPGSRHINPKKLPPPDTHVLVSCRIYELHTSREAFTNRQSPQPLFPGTSCISKAAANLMEVGCWLTPPLRLFQFKRGFEGHGAHVSWNSSFKSQHKIQVTETFSNIFMIYHQRGWRSKRRTTAVVKSVQLF